MNHLGVIQDHSNLRILIIATNKRNLSSSKKEDFPFEFIYL